MAHHCGQKHDNRREEEEKGEQGMPTEKIDTEIVENGDTVAVFSDNDEIRRIDPKFFVLRSRK